MQLASSIRALFITVFLIPIVSFATMKEKDFSIDFGADAYIRAFTKDKESGKKGQGLAQLIRVRMDITAKEGLSIKTRTVLSGDKWDGDTPNGNSSISGNSDDGGGGNSLRLDYGYLEYLYDGWIFRGGRQTADWAHCLTTCDDRRDRLLAMKSFAGVYVAAVYDKRYEGIIDQDGDDGDMYGVLLLDFGKYHEAGLLAAYWQNDDDTYVLNKVWNISPYIKFKRDGYEINLLYNWLGQGSSNSWFSGHHHAGSLQLGKTFKEKYKIEAQTLQVLNGGYLTTGFDTYLSMVNNNPDHNQSNIQALRVGGFGTFTGGKNHKDSIYTARFSYNYSNDLTLGVAGGYLKVFKLALGTRVESYAYDMTANYRLNKRANIKASFGRLNGDLHLSAGSLAFHLNY